ncbi:MAG: maleylacetoacetate isomerase [Phenylobacterium sp.]|nr:maleylacetoacetate isomerase [Phenylobacterium sp.]
MALTLYSYWRATAPYRVRIALALKGLAYDYAPVSLPGGEQRAPDYLERNPQGLTPMLVDGDTAMTQSLALMEWLEETHPQPPLLPADPSGRQVVRAMAGIIACDIHPLNNLRIQQQLAAFGVSEADRQTWVARWMTEGFEALEALIAGHGQGFAYGAAPGLADCCLVPQVYSAERYGVDLSPYRAIRAAAERARAHPAFAAAHPDRQPDAPAPA